MSSHSRRRDARPVLLLGAGPGEATCGILYLASYLRRHGVEAVVRLFDDDVTPKDIRRSLTRLLQHVKPGVVGVSLKWFHHLSRARLIADAIKAIDPSVRVVLGGNTAAYWWRELSSWTSVDDLVLGDGEAPLLALCQGHPAPPNVVRRGADGPSREPLAYVQGATSDETYYSHFDDLFLSQLDACSFSGWVAPGKGCSENCLYCGGTRGVQRASFGRAKAFLRPEGAVQRDHREVLPRTWQLRYDFQGSSAEYLEACWGDVDLSKHSTTYFLWGVPRPGLLAALSRRFARVFVVLDIGCFSETQRLEQMKRGLLKPCPTDAELVQVIDEARRYPNLELEVSGIAGLPFASRATLDEERRHVDRVLAAGCVIGYQRLEAQPGALVTEHPARFDMETEARTFDEFLAYFDAREPGDTHVPMVRFRDAALEAAVAETARELEALAQARLEARTHVALTPRTRLQRRVALERHMTMGQWLGAWRAPPKVAAAEVTVLRSQDGQGLACAPRVDERRCDDPAVEVGGRGAVLLSALDAFARPAAMEAGAGALVAQGLDEDSAFDVVAHLVRGRFLTPA